MSRTRFLTRSFATLALASAFWFAGSPAQADEAPCAPAAAVTCSAPLTGALAGPKPTTEPTTAPATEPSGGIISDGGPTLVGDTLDTGFADAATGSTRSQVPTAARPAHAAVVGLPETGGVPSWLAPVGLSVMLAGAVLVRNSRRTVQI